MENQGEIWQPSVKLRWKEEVIQTSTYETKTRTLQQLHTNSLGNQKWIDVEVEYTYL